MNPLNGPLFPSPGADAPEPTGKGTPGVARGAA